MNTQQQPELLTPKEVAAYLKVSEKTLERWRTEGRGPNYIRLNDRVVRYSMADIKAWFYPDGPTRLARFMAHQERQREKAAKAKGEGK